MKKVSCALLSLLLTLPALAQTNHAAPPLTANQTNQSLTITQQIEQARMDCIEERRTICGKILKITPAGIVVDSGYTNLMRAPLNRSWLASGRVAASRTADLVEERQPGCVCVGLVFLTDLPKKPLPKVYDYVILTGYPAGQYTYTSVGDIRRTVRKFSGKLEKAVQWKLGEIAQAKSPS